MAARRPFLLVLASIVASMGASYRTPNFTVEAPTYEIAQQVGQYAEHYRKEKAMQWLGQEMPQWGQPCPLRVTLTDTGSGGATEFVYEQGQVLQQRMHIEGKLDRLLASVLPHEVTHTVFAYYFRRPVPRWADEGGAVLSEDTLERNRHDMLAWEIVNTQGRAIPLRRLLPMQEYPRDVLCLYAEGYSVANFLVGKSGRPEFLAFVSQGMREGWDNALRSRYGYNTVNELEQAWMTHLRDNRRNPAQVASNTRPQEADPASRILVRLTVPPSQPLQENRAPVYRGQAPESEGDAGWSQPPRSLATGSRPPLPRENYGQGQPAGYPQQRWQPAPGELAPPGPVYLGPPQAFPPQGAPSGYGR